VAETGRYDDEGVRAFIEQQPRHLTFSEMAAACVQQFGPERAWSRSEIEAYWHRTHRPRFGPVSKVDRDPEVRDFLADRLGRLTLDETIRECRKEFGADRTPGRSSVHKFWSRLRTANVQG
jgi:hypothetical protein